jgi:hypothetical protein
MQEGQFARWKQMKKVDIHRELERMLGKEAEFRGLQEPAIRAIMRHESPILAVMGTGVGKSMSDCLRGGTFEWKEASTSARLSSYSSTPTKIR